MANWVLTIDLTDVWDRSAPFERTRDAVVQRIRDSKWIEWNPWVEAILYYLESTKNAKEFDRMFQYIYDAADDERVWIATF